MHVSRYGWACGMVTLCLGCGAPRAGAQPTVLPLAKLRLYETGIGYFERSGTLTPSERAGLPVPASHLDDALRSLVVLTPADGDRLRSVQFASSVSRGIARALAGLAAPADSPIGYRDLLASLKGTHIEVTTRSTSLAGRLVDLDDAVVPVSGDPPGQATSENAPAKTPGPFGLLLATDGGDIVHIAAGDVQAVRPTEPGDRARLGEAIAAQSTRAAQSRKILDVLAEAHGPITLAYIGEAPVWRTTYRILLARGAGPATLQAWALVHNDTEEDWRNVRLELANGRPDSFLFPMAAPRYARRELVHPDDTLSTVPQLLDRTVDTLWGDGRDADEGEGSEAGGGSGAGYGSGGLGIVGHGAGGNTNLTGPSSVLAVGDLAKIAQASGVEAGSLFVYTMPDRLTLGTHDSALVPFVQSSVDAEPIAWVTRAGQPARAAVRFVNSTAQTLPAGTVALFADGGFAGETALDRLKPGERRFLQYAADLDVAVDPAGSAAPNETEATERLTWDHGALVEHFLRTVRSQLTFVNRSAQPRAVYLGLAIQPNARVTGADAVDYDAPTSTPLAVVRVAARGRVDREITTVEGLSRPIVSGDLSSDTLARILGSPELSPADRVVANGALARQKELEDTQRAKKSALEGVAAAETDLARLRDDAKALGGERAGPPQTDLARRLLTVEDRYEAARKQVDDLGIEEQRRAERVVSSLGRLSP
jgi:hypothetical protein